MQTLVKASAVALAMVTGIANAVLADPPGYYVGAGVRTGLNDSTAFVIDSKLRLTDLDNTSLSVRPAVLFADDVELRLPLTLEGTLDEGIYPYLGAGVAYNADGLSNLDPMVTGGVDLNVLDNFVVDLQLNVIFESGVNDTDTEFIATLNYLF